MTQWNHRKANVGDEIPILTLEPISRSTLAIYAGASGDHNPIHIDIDFAKQSGLSDVIAHGMLVMAYIGRALTNAVPQSAIQQFCVEFSSLTQVNDILICSGKVAERTNNNGQESLTLNLTVHDTKGNQKLNGNAKIIINDH